MKKLEISKKFKLIALTTCMILSPINISKEVYAKDNTSIVENEESFTLLELCEKYGKIYSIKPEIILDAVEFKTNGYSDLIDNNWERTVLYTAKELYEDSRSNGYYDKITTGEEYTVTENPEVLIEEYSDVIGSNKYIVLAICLAEKEPHVYLRDDWNYSTNGVLGGLCSPSHFENGEIGVISYICTLKDDYGVTEDSDSSILSSMASIYCPPNAYNWENNLVKPIYNELVEEGHYNRSPEELKNKEKKKEK